MFFIKLSVSDEYEHKFRKSVKKRECQHQGKVLFYSLLSNWFLFFCRLLCDSVGLSTCFDPDLHLHAHIDFCWPHALILHNPNTACSHRKDINRPILTLLTAYHKHSYWNPQHACCHPPFSHLFFFPAPPLHIPLELRRTSLLFLNFEFMQATARNIAVSHWATEPFPTGLISAWWPLKYVWNTFLPHQFFGHINLIMMMNPASSSIICKSLALIPEGADQQRCSLINLWMSSTSLTQWVIKMKTMDIACSISI